MWPIVASLSSWGAEHTDPQNTQLGRADALSAAGNRTGSNVCFEPKFSKSLLKDYKFYFKCLI